MQQWGRTSRGTWRGGRTGLEEVESGRIRLRRGGAAARPSEEWRRAANAKGGGTNWSTQRMGSCSRRLAGAPGEEKRKGDERMKRTGEHWEGEEEGAAVLILNGAHRR